MNYKILKKFIIIILITLISITLFPMQSLSADSLGSIISAGDSFIASSNKDLMDTTSMKGFSDTLYNILLTLGVIVAVVFAIILGIQYVMAAAEDKAQIKEAMIPFIIGCIVVFGAFAIWKALVTILA